VRGVICDPILIRELDKAGSDLRCGVNLICRPPNDFSALIFELQNKLKQIEPDQYYYPLTDLHLTLFEVAHSLKPDAAALIGEMMASRPEAWLTGLHSFTLHSPRMAYDERGCLLRFESDEQFTSLRCLISTRVSVLGIPLKPRYGSASAHVTFMRYVRPLTTNLKDWSDLLCDLARHMTLTWSVREFWLTWGATWFGMRSRIKERGPYSLP
jgi:2'-5' RNA ligase